MNAVANTPTDPPSELRFRRRVHTLAALAQLWRSRELIRTLSERELRARYKQAVLGFAWAVLVPITYMLVFTVFFRRVATIDTEGVPYALFSYVGLLPWTFFSTAVALGGTSLLSNLSLLNKVYCPREVFPIASVGVAGIDTAIATVALGLLFVITTFMPQIAGVWWIPVLLLVQVGFTLGVVLLLSSVIVYVRDVRHLLPIILQLGVFATPVAYGLDAVPGEAQWIYSLLNPLAPVIDGYRQTILYGQTPDLFLLGLGAISALLWLVVGYTVFKRLETGIADVA